MKWHKNRILFNILIGFLIAILPILIILIQLLISLGYWNEFIWIAIRKIFKYGLSGIILSIFYTLIYKYSKQIANILALVLVIVYYIVMLGYIIIIEYFRIVGSPI